MTALTIVPDRPDSSALTAEAAALVAQANALTVTDAASYTAAGEFGKGVRSLQNKITDFFAPHKKRADAVHKGLCDEENKQLEPTKLAVRIIANKMTAWKNVEDRRREDERRDREALARKQEEDRRIQEALDAEADGDIEGAERALSDPLSMPFIPLSEPSAPKVQGVATTKRWTFELENFAAVVMHIAGVEKLAHPELLHMLTLETTTTRQLVVSMKDQFRVPGIRAYQADGVSFGSK